MKVSYVSDLHLDFHVPFTPNQIKWKSRTKGFIDKLIETDIGSREVLVIAGDLSHFNAQSYWALEKFSNHYEQVYFCFGNHDYYLVSKNQENKYRGHSMRREAELMVKVSNNLDNVKVLTDSSVHEHKGVRFAGMTMWYPLETPDQQMFFYNISNDSKLIKGMDISYEHERNQIDYEELLQKDVDVMISHIPVINVDSHFKYNSTACYLCPVKGIEVEHWIMAHSHEQKVYEKPYCTFYMNAIGYSDEELELSIKHFYIDGGDSQ